MYMKIAAFDIFENDYDINGYDISPETLFLNSFDEDGQEEVFELIPDQTKELGYESPNAISNLKSLFVALMI